MLNTYAYGYTKYPNAAREYLRFMWEREQVDAWLRAANGYVSPPLPAWNDNPVWTDDPKVTPFRDRLEVCARQRLFRVARQSFGRGHGRFPRR